MCRATVRVKSPNCAFQPWIFHSMYPYNFAFCRVCLEPPDQRLFASSCRHPCAPSQCPEDPPGPGNAVFATANAFCAWIASPGFPWNFAHLPPPLSRRGSINDRHPVPFQNASAYGFACGYDRQKADPTGRDWSGFLRASYFGDPPHPEGERPREILWIPGTPCEHHPPELKTARQQPCSCLCYDYDAPPADPLRARLLADHARASCCPYVSACSCPCPCVYENACPYACENAFADVSLYLALPQNRPRLRLPRVCLAASAVFASRSLLRIDAQFQAPA
mmetsp:Transcript_49365/g.94360  ORF Transcript_49365/g.94360 Transcript_49365/m.94360 type:complete len:279 (-) Transcript_49365:623-1459(-)